MNSRGRRWPLVKKGPKLTLPNSPRSWWSSCCPARRRRTGPWRPSPARSIAWCWTSSCRCREDLAPPGINTIKRFFMVTQIGRFWATLKACGENFSPNCPHFWANVEKVSKSSQRLARSVGWLGRKKFNSIGPWISTSSSPWRKSPSRSRSDFRRHSASAARRPDVRCQEHGITDDLEGVEGWSGGLKGSKVS